MPTKVTQSETQRIPKLRFPGFSGGWEEKKLENISKINPSTEDLPNEFIYIDLESVDAGTLKQENKIKKTEAPSRAQRVLQKNDILFQTVRPYQQNNLLFNFSGNYVASTGYAQIRAKDNPMFLYQYIHTPTFLNKVLVRCTGSNYPAINSSDVKKIKVSIPSLLEQQKIASFLESTDELINNLKEQKENLESYKKGMMQKIFPSKGGQVSEIRFKPARNASQSDAGGDENGKEFPELEYKKLGQICNIKKGIQLNREGLSENVGNPVINGGVEPSGYTDIWNTKSNTITISEGGNSCGFVNFIKKDFWCGGHCYSLLDLNKSINLVFLYQYLKFLEKNIMRLRVGSGLPNIQKKDMEKLRLMIPLSLEQQKIADFLGSIDKLIESKQEQITEAEQWKKGLMQGLFV